MFGWDQTVDFWLWRSKNWETPAFSALDDYLEHLYPPALAISRLSG